MLQLRDTQSLQNFKNALNGQCLALVPTMGALHDGHLALVKAGMACADICLPYIFLNPAQFAEGEDLDKYPQTLDQDLEKLEKMGVEAVWVPSTQDIYPNGTAIMTKAGALAKPLEGEHRPHFFDGVVTVVKRMFELAQPNIALFGEKDFQQLQVIREMTARYQLPIDIIGVPTMRDKNGLALSSRNVYLSEQEYEIAIHLNQVLVQLAQNMITEKEAKSLLLDMGFSKIDYCTARNSQTFLPENPDRILAAAWIGKTRLIDNIRIID